MMYTKAAVSSCWTFLSVVFMVISFQSSKWIPSSFTRCNYVVNAFPLNDNSRPIPEFGKFYYLAMNINIYGFPLLEGIRLFKTTTTVNCTSAAGYAPVNVFSHMDNFLLLTAAPNTDVVYSPVTLDLTKGPVVIEHPDMGLRYFSFQLTDPYTNVIEYLGSRTTGREAARFAIKWKHDNTTGHTHLTNINKTITVDYAGISVLGRVLVNDPNSDLEPAINLARQFKAIPPGGEIIVPKCQNDTKFYQYPMPGGLDFYRELNKALALFPPPAADNRFLKKIEALGIGGKFAYTDTLTKIFLNGLKRRASLAANRACVPVLKRTIKENNVRKKNENNGWRKTPDNVGNYGTDYLIRAATAIVGFGANSPDEAFYQAAYYDNKGSPLHSNSTYQLVFEPGMEPPVNEFWSITLYKLDYTIPMNVLEPIYSIASKKSNFVRQTDGTIVIHISRSKPYEATTIPKTINWLPSPLSDENFYIMLRGYHPQQSVLDFTWKAPGIQQVI